MRKILFLFHFLLTAADTKEVLDVIVCVWSALLMDVRNVLLCHFLFVFSHFKWNVMQKANNEVHLDQLFYIKFFHVVLKFADRFVWLN